ncbi:glycoside hydrolase family 3 protein [Treponema parvum]|uniref:glycoside hydrolase family 3 protein n=1 Tax=Treponema parvum TaxID=138851 RepID=UPI001AEC5EA9|nr:glycoside hydrolase family 3 protein [Treponema parvum]QTQ15307.1 glycoside hydrolase family 3 protein [Treponema parvum]
MKKIVALSILLALCLSAVLFTAGRAIVKTSSKNPAAEANFAPISETYSGSAEFPVENRSGAAADQKNQTEIPSLADCLPPDITFWSDYPSDVLAEALIRRMEDSELLAQIFMFGWAGAEPSELLNQWVSDRGLGSVKIFGWNTDDINLVAKSVSEIQKKAQGRRYKIPLFVATDQEGGWIRHVKGATANTPGNLAIGASGYPFDAWYSGYYINREIHALGINMNFAPSVDLYTNHHSAIIGTRSFGEDPDNSGVLGAAFAAGSMAAGVIPTAKHFPGHGATDEDSHLHLPTIDIDFETWSERELVPFKYLIAEKIPAVMSGHLGFPKITNNGEPASLSETFLTQILRDKLGYEGLIITDDMMMNGDTMYAGSVSNAFRMAIEAGNDIIISSTTAHLNESLWTSNLARMKNDLAFRETVIKAARRVLKVKLDYFKNENAAPLYPDTAAIPKRIPDEDGRKFFLEQACRSITPYKADGVPLKKEDAGRVLLAGAFPSYFAEGKKRFPGAAEFRFNYEIGPNETQWMIDNILYTAASFDTVVFCVHNGRTRQIADRLKSLKDSGKKIIILSIMSPENAFSLTWSDAILMGYSYSEYTAAALFGALAGEFSPKGVLPILNE